MENRLDQSLCRPLSHLLRLDWEKVLYIVLVVLALLTRLAGLGDRVQSHDESLHTKYSWDLFAGFGYRHTPLMHGPSLFHITAFSYFLFGDDDFTARLPVALIGVALVALPYWLRRWLGRAGALSTAGFLLISPAIAYYSRYIRHDIPLIVASLVVVVALWRYLEDGHDRWLALLAVGVALMFTTMEAAFIYNATFGVFLVGVFVVRALGRRTSRPATTGRGSIAERFPPRVVALLVGVVVITALVAVSLPLLQAAGECAHLARGGSEPVSALVTRGVTCLREALPRQTIPARVRLVMFVMPLASALALGAAWLVISEFRGERSLDLIVVLGTLCLPFLTPLAIIVAGVDPVDYNPPSLYYSAALLVDGLVLTVAIGLAWDLCRQQERPGRFTWAACAGLLAAISVTLFTTVFTNGAGIATGFVGSLGYWLAQHGVRRGGQPWYYYLILIPQYEYLPLLLAVAGSCAAWLRAVLGRRVPLFVWFLLWWSTCAWIAYSIAGEKMPWLTVHITLPMILLSGWAAGQLIEWVHWPTVWARATWLLAAFIPLSVVAAVMALGALAGGAFRGDDLAALEATGRFLGGLLGLAVLGTASAFLVRRSGWRPALGVAAIAGVLALSGLTVHTAWRFCFVNFDYASEMLVYAHSAPAVKETMRQIEDLSRRTAGGPEQIRVAYGADGSWPFHWYLRNYRNAVFYGQTPSREAMSAPVVIAGREEWDKVQPYLADGYTVNTYTYLWWPAEDYRDLTWPRLTRVLTDTQMQLALWKIWLSRDYSLYDELTGKVHTLDQWPLRNEYRLYIRRDVAADIWDLTTGPSAPSVVADPYAAGWQERAPRLVIGGPGAGPGQFQGPRGVDVDEHGSIYVADAGNNRVQVFSATGEFVAQWPADGMSLREPWDVAVAPGPTLYVADTWNHAIRKLDAGGETLLSWGEFGQFGPLDAGGQSAFYGPRGLALGPNGWVYVTDTGNKRVQVFDASGGFLYQWGGVGALAGYLDEPVGIAVAASGEVYVADTWNMRIQVFDTEGHFLRQWAVPAWNTGSVDEKPYLALDSSGRVYATDPGHGRVLVFDASGAFLRAFGPPAGDGLTLGTPTGIAVASDGSIVVTDALQNHVLVFDRLP